MGIQDLDRLDQIGTYANSFTKYHFTIDTDTKNSDNGITINEYGICYKDPLTEVAARQLKKLGFKRFVPDLLDWKNKRIIEYQEEPKPCKGPKIIQKGHDEFSDENKDLFYKLAGFKQLKIWESDQDWMHKIDGFLIDF
jgi:hypothetical protein